MLHDLHPLAKLLLMSLWTIGYCCTFWEGMIFERIGNWMDAHLPKWIQPPLYACYICACFWWGSALYWVFLGSDWGEWFVCTISAMGFNAALSKLFRDD